MGAILGLGLSHYPGLLLAGGEKPIRRFRGSKVIPQELQDPATWPPQMRAEWGDDEGASFVAAHQDRFAAGVRILRSALDDFHPDLVIMFGDDQYENFREDIIPPFCIYIFDEVESRPFVRPGSLQGSTGGLSRWGDPYDAPFSTRGHPTAARHLTQQLMAAGFDVPYSYATRYQNGLSHAFVNTQLYLDWDRAGWDYPTVPVHVNAYGSSIVRTRGAGARNLTATPAAFDPPAPAPRRCFEFGQAIADIMRESPWRVALVGSASWSHASLTAKNAWLHSDLAADQRRFDELRRGDYLAWRDLDLCTIEDTGQHEVLNWMPLVGAMHELGQRATWSELLETQLLNSCKALALFPPQEPATP